MPRASAVLGTLSLERAGYLVVPPGLVDAFGAAVRLTGHQVPAAEQAALADFITEGHFASHVRRMRALYAVRREHLVAALRRRLSGLLEVVPSEGGMQLAATLAPGVDDAAASRAAGRRGPRRAAALDVSPGRTAAPGSASRLC